jgi:hypothetical protein
MQMNLATLRAAVFHWLLVFLRHHRHLLSCRVNCPLKWERVRKKEKTGSQLL